MSVLLSLLLATAGSAQQPGPVADPAAYYQAYETANSLYETGRYTEAAGVVAGLTSEFSQDPSLWFLLARARDRVGGKRAAIDAYRVTFRIGYQYGAWVPYRVAQLYGELGGVDSAFVWLDRALDVRYNAQKVCSPPAGCP